ncbi:MAG: alpha/beta hydrolase [Gammaproteobacteria bacterium]
MRSLPTMRMRWLAVIAAAAPLCSAMAQEYRDYPSVKFPAEESNQGLNFAAYYARANELTAQARRSLRTRLDQPFGPNPKQRLDLYLPKQPVKNAPVVLFIHGGAFEEGDRAHYGFVAQPFAAQAMVTAITGYRLTSREPNAGFKYPAQADDVKQAVLWLYKHVAEYGGNPHAIFVVGHSAGAILAADVGVDRSWLTRAGVPEDALRGIVPISARYDFVNVEPMNPDWAPTPELREQASPLRHIKNAAPFALIAYGEKEPQLAPAARDLNTALTTAKVSSQVLVVPGADHAAIALSLNDATSPLSQAIQSLIKSARR